MRPDARVVCVLLAVALNFAQPTAAADFSDCDEAARLLLAPELRSDQERASEAGALLVAERKRKLAGLSSAFVDLGLHASVQAAPLKLLRTVGAIGRDLRDWNDRSEVEDEALVLLAPGVRSGDLDAEGLALYERLERRETSERIAGLLDDSDRALAGGDLRRARRGVERALALEPGSKRADRLLDAIARRESRAMSESLAGVDAAALHESIDAWEVKLGTALLVDDFTRARALGPEDASDAALARAAARFLEGDRAHALDEFERIAHGEDRSAVRARKFLADPSLNPARALDEAVSLFRTRRALGWMGGADLAETAVPSTDEALSLTRNGYRAWQSSYKAWRNALRPVNLVIDAPARAWRSWQPDGRALHAAAESYLELAPQGERAAEAAAWLESLQMQESGRPRVAAFRDGVLVLPSAQTRWGRLASTRVIVARAALDAEAPELLEKLGIGTAPALLLALDTEMGRPAAMGTSLSKHESLELISRLATGLEQASLAARGGNPDVVLETLRRLDARLVAGRRLVAQPWTPDAGRGIDALGSAVVDGERTRTVGDVELQRHREALLAERELGGAGAFCPRETACIDARNEVASALFARTDADGELGVGASAGFEDARFTLEIGTSGPRASLVIPFARWLGIGHFFPVEARVAVGLDGFSAGPHLDDL